MKGDRSGSLKLQKGVAKLRKVALLVAAEIALLAVIGFSFWFQDLRYSLPTPRPVGWRAPAIGSSFTGNLDLTKPVGSRPALFNFYNCDCPCSRFNLDHVRQLAKTFGSRVRFVAVIEGGTEADEKDVFKGLNLEAEPYYDANGKLARELGVYATPQAVLIDSKHRLVYRGNYNLSRFCIDTSTEFVRLALESVTSGQPLPAVVQSSVSAYGCAIPACSIQPTRGK